MGFHLYFMGDNEQVLSRDEHRGHYVEYHTLGMTLRGLCVNLCRISRLLHDEEISLQ